MMTVRRRSVAHGQVTDKNSSKLYDSRPSTLKGSKLDWSRD